MAGEYSDPAALPADTESQLFLLQPPLSEGEMSNGVVEDSPRREGDYDWTMLHWALFVTFEIIDLADCLLNAFDLECRRWQAVTTLVPFWSSINELYVPMLAFWDKTMKRDSSVWLKSPQHTVTFASTYYRKLCVRNAVLNTIPHSFYSITHSLFCFYPLIPTSFERMWSKKPISPSAENWRR